MKTMLKVRSGLHKVLIPACAILFATVTAACGGSGGAAQPGPQLPRPTPSPVPGPAPVAACTAQQYQEAWATLSCPAGMLCIGEVYGTDVANITVLTEGRRPDWSPDGSQLVFERRGWAPALGWGVFRINADGTGEEELADGREPAWSPDGRKIAFQHHTGIAVMNADGSDLTTLLPHDFANSDSANVSAPTWSPDSQRIAFVQSGVEIEMSDLYVMDSDGSNAHALFKSPFGRIKAPAWAPASGVIAFIRDVGLYVVDAGGGDPSHIYNEIRYLTFDWSQTADWSTDGSTIWFSTKADCTALGVHSFEPLVGPAIQRVVGAQQPAWSPDGTRLAFASAVDAYLPLTRPARVFNLDGIHSNGSRSRYVLYDDGGFELQYSSMVGGIYSYFGTYSGENPIHFELDVCCGSESWRATGTLNGTRLTIRYNRYGFESGVYVLDESQQ